LDPPRSPATTAAIGASPYTTFAAPPAASTPNTAAGASTCSSTLAKVLLRNDFHDVANVSSPHVNTEPQASTYCVRRPESRTSVANPTSSARVRASADQPPAWS
jgi:hypothetical protein